jgi:glycosyltransferase involved in cell wall biosynthesis
VRILLVNWQDRENPQSGGAEIHLHEIFGRLASYGHEVVLMCGGWPGCTPRAILDGIDVRRVGTRYTFPFMARRHWATQLRPRQFDVLIEDINKVPLYTPAWSPGKVIALVPHLFGETVFQEAGFGLGSAVWLSELPLRAVYGRTPFHAISDSTADDLVTRGISRASIRVIYPGVAIDVYRPNSAARSPAPLFAYLGRLKKYKRVDLIMRAIARLRLEGTTVKLIIAGKGDAAEALTSLASELGINDLVEMRGFVSEGDKRELFRRTWAHVLTSPKEGWGISNLEAAGCGTATIASDAPGLRDSVRDGETGFLVPHGDITALADAIKRITVDTALRDRLGRNAREFAQRFTWDRAANDTESHLQSLVGAA